jgi:hypothetical protein
VLKYFLKEKLDLEEVFFYDFYLKKKNVKFLKIKTQINFLGFEPRLKKFIFLK